MDKKKIIMNVIRYKNHRNLQYYLLLLFGFLLFISFIWFRFLRERLPRNIPFHPKFLGFMLLLFICISYIYLITTIYRRPKNNKYLSNASAILFKPFTVLDDFFKEAISQKIHERLLKKWQTKVVHAKIVIIRYSIIPRLILLIIFSMDVYLYNELDDIYNMVFFRLFPLFARYIKYSLKKSLDKNILLLSNKVDSVVTSYVHGIHPAEWPENANKLDPEDEDDDIPETMCLPLEIFINY